MDIKNILVLDDTSEKVIQNLRGLLNVDIGIDMSTQKVLEVIEVSLVPMKKLYHILYIQTIN